MTSSSTSSASSERRIDLDLPIVMAGVPARNPSLQQRIRFLVGDPVAYVGRGRGIDTSVLVIRDIELERARRDASADEVLCPADLAPEGGLSGDRETAFAQALAECLRRRGARAVRSDRTLPLVFAEHLRLAGIAVVYDPDLGVLDRRRKDAEEVARLREAQRATEDAIGIACRTIARADAAADGRLRHRGEWLTADMVRGMLDARLLELGFDNPPSIVACGPQGGDCHERGQGILRTGEPVIIDVFPRSKTSLYHGDCTRTVVHGDAPDAVRRMHAAVVAAKRAAIAAVRPGATGEAVHVASISEIRRHGLEVGRLPEPDAPNASTWIGMTHGTGHGIGLEVHEPPLLDFKGPPLVEGDALTVEPGVYGRGVGGLRIEDLVVVTASGCENLNALPEGLDWR